MPPNRKQIRLEGAFAKHLAKAICHFLTECVNYADKAYPERLPFEGEEIWKEKWKEPLQHVFTRPVLARTIHVKSSLRA